ncbi:hypothetical protein P692DRAFT_201861495 [Suillus brevipes Sb2]|nr:hypothetical protein P692DRAFT_201861495 [Suillus brevipes Sb2]
MPATDRSQNIRLQRLEPWNGTYPIISVQEDYVHNQPTVAPPTHVRNYDTRTQVRMIIQRHMQRAQATTVTVASSILTDVEIETDPSISYPTLEVFMAKLDDEEPGRRWSEIFLPPLRWMGVKTIDDMCIVSPKSLSGFFNLSPIMVMDLYVHIVDAVFELQARKITPQELEISLSIYQLDVRLSEHAEVSQQ